jgi:hypothetical protein
MFCPAIGFNHFSHCGLIARDVKVKSHSEVKNKKIKHGKEELITSVHIQCIFKLTLMELKIKVLK